MTTQAPYGAARSPAAAPSKNSATFDHCMVALAVFLVFTLASAASILVTLPEALDAVATPAFGAPWITAAAPANTHDQRHHPAARTTCAVNSSRRSR